MDIITSDKILESLRKSISDLEMSLHDSLKLININSNMTFSQILFSFIDFSKKNSIIDNKLNNLLDDYSAKIIKLDSYKDYQQDMIFMLLYISIMMYNDLSNPDVKNKIKIEQFTKMVLDFYKFPKDMIKNIYNDAYDKIKQENIENNLLHDKKMISNKKTCIIL
jgi:hypothetical protein